MSLWHSVRGEARAAALAVRYHADPAYEGSPRSERIVAAGIGLVVLSGAIGTYFAVVGGLHPLLTRSPADHRPPAAPAVEPAPDPAHTAGGSGDGSFARR